MRTIKRTTKFKRDYKRELKGKFGATLDHALGGDWKLYRDCHLRPDLVLIYPKPDEDTLCFVRLGSHSELGL